MSKPLNLPKSKIIRTLHSAKRPSATTTLYTGISNAQREIRLQRSSLSQRSIQSKQEFERTITGISENDDFTVTYHPWNSDYHRIVTREKNIKAMTKDPYTPIARLISHAVEGVTTETECSPTLISAKAVTINRFNIKQSPRSSFPTVVRYLRRNESMPSEQPAQPSTSRKFSLLSQSQYKKPTISVMDTSKLTRPAPALVITDRSLNRDKIRNDRSVIRRPPRKLVANVSHDTILPLSVYG